MNQFRHLFMGVILALVSAACGADPATESVNKTPVILISLDTCRADRLGFMGSKNPNSPALDYLARQSVVFTDCITQSSNTGPSHRSLFTGMFPMRHRHTMGSYVRSPFSMAELLKESGYSTGAFTGGGFVAGKLGFSEGFDTYVDRDERLSEQYRRGLQTILPQADAWYQQQKNQNDPFFMFLHTYDIHCPYWPTEPYQKRYGDWYKGDAALQQMCGQDDFKEFLGGDIDNEDLNYLNAMYDAGIAMTDEMLGRFLAMLEKDGVLDQALIIVVSDHGENLGEHRYIGHNTMWEEQLQVPLLVRFPGGKYAGTRIPDPVMLVDVLPTVLDYLGIVAPEGIQGRSLMPLVDGIGSFGSERFRLSMHLSRLSFRFDNQWKVVLKQEEDGRARAKLYDLVNDPRERNNLMQENSANQHKKLLEGLVARYQEWRESERGLDEKLTPQMLAGALDANLSDELDALGYTDFEEGL